MLKFWPILISLRYVLCLSESDVLSNGDTLLKNLERFCGNLRVNTQYWTLRTDPLHFHRSRYQGQGQVITSIPLYLAWWRHQMETFSALLALCAGKSPVNSRHQGQWRGALMFSLICACINGKGNSREAGDLRRRRAHYDVIVMGI